MLLLLWLASYLAKSQNEDSTRLPDPVPIEVERIYAKGLRYLAEAQLPQGCWDENYGRFPGVVGLAMLAILAHGDDPVDGPYREHIRRSVDYILSKQQAANGMIGDSMYNHGFATLALAEVYGTLEEDKRLGPALKRATELILSAQKRNPHGAWRYDPETREADTTVAGTQMVALFAARNAGIAIADEAISKGLAFYDRCRSPGGGYGYMSNSAVNVTRTAIGMLVFSLAKKENGPGWGECLRYLTADLDYRDQQYPFYYEYYMAQALFHIDTELWKEWDKRNVAYLSSIQQADGRWTSNHGDTFSTAAALLSMALHYRYLPIYER